MLKVLVAEDNLILADFLAEFLVSQGYDVCGKASTVGEAVALADLHKPDLAVIDFRLGDGGSGSQISRDVKDRSSLGILYVSGDPLGCKLTRNDGEAYIQKPYGMNDVVRSLRIVHDIKSNKRTSPSDFPRSFHLLENAERDRCSA